MESGNMGVRYHRRDVTRPWDQHARLQQTDNEPTQGVILTYFRQMPMEDGEAKHMYGVSAPIQASVIVSICTGCRHQVPQVLVGLGRPQRNDRGDAHGSGHVDGSG